MLSVCKPKLTKSWQLTLASFIAVVAMPLLANVGLDIPEAYLQSLVLVFLGAAGAGVTGSAMKRKQQMKHEEVEGQKAMVEIEVKNNGNIPLSQIDKNIKNEKDIADKASFIKDLNKDNSDLAGMVKELKGELRKLEDVKERIKLERDELREAKRNKLMNQIEDGLKKSKEAKVVGITYDGKTDTLTVPDDEVGEGLYRKQVKEAMASKELEKAIPFKDYFADTKNVYGKSKKEIEERYREITKEAPERIRFTVGGGVTEIPNGIVMEGYRIQKNTIYNAVLKREEFPYGTPYLYTKILKSYNHLSGMLWKKSNGMWAAIQPEQSTGDENNVLRFEMFDSDKTPMDRGVYGLMWKFMTRTGQGGKGVDARDEDVEDELDEFEIV